MVKLSTSACWDASIGRVVQKVLTEGRFRPCPGSGVAGDVGTHIFKTLKTYAPDVKVVYYPSYHNFLSSSVTEMGLR